MTQTGVSALTRYRCPQHTDIPVTWRNTGCPECQQERNRPRRHWSSVQAHQQLAAYEQAVNRYQQETNQ